jgi:positive regulator of sigma E activity
MSQEGTIEHPGTILEIDPNNIQVRILAKSACSTCHVKAACSAADMEDKVIEVKNVYDNLSVGETVTVFMKRSYGPRAVVFAYLIPFAILFGGLLAIYFTTGKEGLAAIGSIVLLIPYYFILYYMKDRFKNKFEFRIRKNKDETKSLQDS